MLAAYKHFACARGLGFSKPGPLSLPRKANLAIPISFCYLHKKVFESIDICPTGALFHKTLCNDCYQPLRVAFRQRKSVASMDWGVREAV